MKKFLLVFLLMVLISCTGKAQSIPNRDFEYWDSTSYDVPDSPWICSNPAAIANLGMANVTKVPGFSGLAVHIQTDIVNGDTLVGQISNTGDHKLGVPYTQIPTGIKGYFRCKMIGNDTGFMVVAFLKAGTIYFEELIPFYGNVSSFTPFSDTMNVPFAPDTVLIEAVSSNLVNFVDINPGSWIELDELSFTGAGITQQPANGNFDSWQVHTDVIPTGWSAPPTYNEGDTSGVSQSLDHYSGKYSLKLTEPYNVYTQLLSTGKFDENADSYGGQPFTQSSDTLTGYYKYIPFGSDTGGIEITLQNQGNMILQVGNIFTVNPNWTYFEMPFGGSSTPDTMRIDLFATITYKGLAGSVLYLDDLKLKSQPLSGIFSATKPSYGISAFPNPAQSQLNIRFAGVVPPGFGLKIYNSEGRLMIDNQFNSGSSTVSVPIDQLSSGLYFYEVTSNGSTTRNKFVKE